MKAVLIDIEYLERLLQDAKGHFAAAPNKRVKLAARVDCGMNPLSARRSLRAFR